MPYAFPFHLQWDTVLHVSPTGDDNTNNHPDGSWCYRTLTAAKNKAVSGDTIIVFPGTYRETDLLKNGVNWHFVPGATVVNDVSSTAIKNGTQATKAIFDDGGNAIVSRISGFGEFVTTFGTADWDNPNAQPVPCNINRRAFVNLNNAASDVTIQFNRATYSGYADGGVQLCYCINALQLTLQGVYLGTTNAASSTQIGVGESNGPFTVYDVFGGIWWAQGETYVDILQMKSGLYCLYPEGTGVAAATNLWVKTQRMESTVFATVYMNGVANANWKVWIDAMEIICSSSSFNAALHIQSNGKLYLNYMKISSLGSLIGYFQGASAVGLQVWMTGQKASATVNGSDGFIIGGTSGGTNNFPVTFWGRVLQYEDVSTQSAPNSTMIRVKGTSTKAIIQGGYMATVQNRAGITHENGLTHVVGMRIETNATNDVDNKPVVLSAAGCILDDCTLLAPALADSIYAGSAQTVKIYGTTYANKAKNANVTVQAGLGALVADANVT